MKKYLTKWLVTITAVSMTLLNTAAYAYPDPILTDTFPIVIFDGVKWTPDSYFETEEYLSWEESMIDKYGMIYEVEYPTDEICAGKSVAELEEYLRLNAEKLIEDETLKLTGYAGMKKARLSLGEIQDVEYESRFSIYLIPIKDGKTAVLQSPEGYVFLGGAYDPERLDGLDVTEYLTAEVTAQSGWKAEIIDGICSAQRFSGDAESGYLHENEMYWFGDLTDKFEKTDLIILPLEDVRGMMATESQNWALEQATEQYGN